MVPKLPRHAGLIALLLLALGAGATFGWFWWNALRNPVVSFLPHRSPAEWIVYPLAPIGGVRDKVELATVFKKSFELSPVASTGRMRIAAFGHYQVLLNGVVVDAPTRPAKNWKEPDLLEAGKQLSAGSNTLVVTVWNSNGPPALWLALELDKQVIATGDGWECSCEDAAWQPASLARKAVASAPGGLLSGGEQSWISTQ